MVRGVKAVLIIIWIVIFSFVTQLYSEGRQESVIIIVDRKCDESKTHIFTEFSGKTVGVRQLLHSLIVTKPDENYPVFLNREPYIQAKMVVSDDSMKTIIRKICKLFNNIKKGEKGQSLSSILEKMVFLEHRVWWGMAYFGLGKGEDRTNSKLMEEIMELMKKSENELTKASPLLKSVFLLLKAHLIALSAWICPDTQERRLVYDTEKISKFMRIADRVKSDEKCPPYLRMTAYWYCAIGQMLLRKWDNARNQFTQIVGLFKEFSEWYIYKMSLVLSKGHIPEEFASLRERNSSKEVIRQILTERLLAWTVSGRYASNLPYSYSTVLIQILATVDKENIYPFPPIEREHPNAVKDKEFLKTDKRLWWLLHRKMYPKQILPEGWDENKILLEFVEELRKDKDIATKYKNLLDKTEQEAKKALEEQKDAPQKPSK